MLRGADLFPTTFDIEGMSEEQIAVMLNTCIETLRMVRDGDTESDNGEARELYSTFFATAIH
jgi:hypothetical protein